MMKRFLIVTCSIALMAGGCKKNDHPATVAPEVAVQKMSATVSLAYSTSTQTNPACFLDLDSAKVYTVGNAYQNSATVDLVYVLRYTAANDPMFISIGNFDGQKGYPISSWDKTTLNINKFTHFNHTSFGTAPAGFTNDVFNGMQYVSQLKTQLAKTSVYLDNQAIDNTYAGRIFVFKTHQGKSGAFRVKDATGGSSGYATIEIIIEP